MYRFHIVIITLLGFASASLDIDIREDINFIINVIHEHCNNQKGVSGNKTLPWRRTLEKQVEMKIDTIWHQFCINRVFIEAKMDCSDHYIYDTSTGHIRPINCWETFKTSERTAQLFILFIEYFLDKDVNYNTLKTITEDIHNFTYVDQFFLSSLFYSMTTTLNLTRLLENYSPVLNNIMELNLNDTGQTFNMFESYHTTLAGINVFFDRILKQHEHSLTSIQAKHFVFKISKPFMENISGFAFYKTSFDSFLNYTVKKVYRNESYDNIETENLEVAGYVSRDVLDYIQENKTKEEREKVKILIAAFDRNKLFHLDRERTVISRIIAVSIYNFCNLEDFLYRPLFYVFLKPCSDISGEWFVIQGKDVYDVNFTHCSFPLITFMLLYNNTENYKINNSFCRVSKRFPFVRVNIHSSFTGNVEYHDYKSNVGILSSFSMSMNYAQPQTVIEVLYKSHDFMLRRIMVFGCGLSLIGVIGLLLTVLMIKNWYQKRWFSLQLTIAMTLQTILFLSSGENVSYVFCITLYYLILSQFTWMMLVGYTQYAKFVKIFKGGEISKVKSLIVGWILPLIVIIIPLCIYPEYLHCQSCTENSLVTIYIVILPTSLIILGNIVIYILVMWNISKSKCQNFGINISNRQTRLALLLPFMLGLTWVFLFALFSPWSTFALIGSYLFHIVAPIQAFVLFVFLVLIDADTRHKWGEIISSYKNNKVHPIKSTINKSINKNDTNVDVFTIFK